jgi:hypothetical protein
VFEDGLPLEHTAGMLALAELVAENAVITTITLRDNCIGPVGLELLVTNLHLNSTLQYLDLQGNLLGPAGCEVGASSCTACLSCQVQRRRSYKVVYGASHRARQLGETGPSRPCDNVEKEILKGGLRC